MKFIGDFDLHLLQHLGFFLCKPAKKKFVHWIQLWGRSHLRSDGVEPSDSKICKLWIEQITPHHFIYKLKNPQPETP